MSAAVADRGERRRGYSFEQSVVNAGRGLKITTTEMEYLVARFLNARVNLIVAFIPWDYVPGVCGGVGCAH